MLRSDKISLGPVLDADSPRLFQWINDRALVLSNSPYKPVSEAQHGAWFASLSERRDLAIFAIRTIPEQTLVGTCQLHTIDPIHRSAELQIRIGEKREQGRGFGTDAVRLLLDFAFRDLNLNRVYLHVLETNRAAIRVYEKAGLRREGVLRQAAHVDGAFVDVVLMGILRGEHRLAGSSA